MSQERVSKRLVHDARGERLHNGARLAECALGFGSLTGCVVQLAQHCQNLPRAGRAPTVRGDVRGGPQQRLRFARAAQRGQRLRVHQPQARQHVVLGSAWRRREQSLDDFEGALWFVPTDRELGMHEPAGATRHRVQRAVKCV